MKKILVYGYGNPGRQDDAMGNIMADRIEEWAKEKGHTNISVDSNYQLNIEDADTISGYDVVFFVDASIEEIDDYIMTKVEVSDATIEFSMHAVSTSFVLDLCQKMYNKTPDTYLIHIKGYEWDFMEQISEAGQANFDKAFEFLKARIEDIDTVEEYLA
jgi:hydrogenase maturation protease